MYDLGGERRGDDPRQEWYNCWCRGTEKHRFTLTQIAWAGVGHPSRKGGRGLVGFEGSYAVMRMLRIPRHSKSLKLGWREESTWIEYICVFT